MHTCWFGYEMCLRIIICSLDQFPTCSWSIVCRVKEFKHLLVLTFAPVRFVINFDDIGLDSGPFFFISFSFLDYWTIFLQIFSDFFFWVLTFDIFFHVALIFSPTSDVFTSHLNVDQIRRTWKTWSPACLCSLVVFIAVLKCALWYFYVDVGCVSVGISPVDHLSWRCDLTL